MKKILLVILLFFLGVLIVHCQEVEYIYTDWFDYYPEGVEEIRIESQDRYRWFKIENDERIETDEYYDYLEGYEKIEESKKTFYRVINSQFLLIGPDDKLVTNIINCRKTFCRRVRIEPYIVNTPEEEPPEEEIINPDTFDPMYYFYYSFIICFVILIVCNIGKIYLVLSNRWK